jgi:hypothetical protein
LDSVIAKSPMAGKCFRSTNPDVPWDMTFSTLEFVQNDSGPLFPTENLGYGFGSSDTHNNTPLPKTRKLHSREDQVYHWLGTWFDRDQPTLTSAVEKGTWTASPIVSSAQGLYYSESFSQPSSAGDCLGSGKYSFWVKRAEPYFIAYSEGEGTVECFNDFGDASHSVFSRAEVCYF